jgi:excisionase family DNA binding protein
MATLLRIAEAAELLGVSGDTLRRWAEDGALAAVRTYGGQLRSREADILTFQQQAEGQRSADPDGAPGTFPRAPARAPRKPVPDRPDWERLPPWERKKAEVEAELAIGDLLAKRRAHKRERIRERRAAQNEAAERERLAELKRLGLRHCSHADQRRRLVAILERFVTSKQIPAIPQ